MYCSQCATRLFADDVYCPNCAKPVASFTFDSTNVAQVELLGEVETVARHRVSTDTESNTESRHSEKPVVPWVVGLRAVFLASALTIVAVVIMIAAFETFKRAPSNQSEISERYKATSNSTAIPAVEPTPLPPTPFPQPERIQIVNTSFPVPARTFRWFTFGSDQPMRVSGGFVAYGGSNDIDAVIVDEDNFRFYRNGLSSMVRYQSGYTQKAILNVGLPAGQYYLVFDNRKALITDKSVAAEVYVADQ